MQPQILDETDIQWQRRLRSHIPALDGVRGIAILMVLCCHFLAATVGLEFFGKPLVNIGLLGWIGVDLFFVLSGFLITGILEDAKGSQHYFRTFFARRALRIFPLYFIFLAATFSMVGRLHLLDASRAADIQHQQGWFWLYCVNFLEALRPHTVPWMLSHLWSLSVEEHFYLLWPLLVYLTPRRTMIAVCGALIVAALAIRIIIVIIRPESVSSFYITPCRMDSLAIGGLLALVGREPSGMPRLIRIARLATPALGMIFAFLYVIWGSPQHDDRAMNTVGYTVLDFFFAGFLVLAIESASSAWLGRVTTRRSLRLFGKYSYGIYVLHKLPFLFVERKLPIAAVGKAVHSILAAAIIQVVVSTILATALAILSWHLIEKRFISLKRFFPTHRVPILEQQTA